MKFGLAARLGWVLALVSALIAGLTGLYAYRASHTLLVASAKNELLNATRVLARRVVVQRQEVTRNLQLLAQHPAVLATLQTQQDNTADQVATLFELLMRGNPNFFQVRLIAADRFGREQVRIDRDGTQLLRVQGDDLQEKSHYTYVSETLALPAGSTYLSRIDINHEVGAHAGLDKPTAKLAAPVMDGNGKALGLVVINVDLNGIFEALGADMQPGFQLFLTNRQGDLLLHPDPALTFGFDRGQRHLLQDEFPATQALYDGTQNHMVLESEGGRYASEPVVAAFEMLPVKVASDEGRLVFGLALPLRQVLAQADLLGETVWKIVVGFGLLGLLLAMLLARLVTRPLNAMSAAVQNFSANQAIAGLPVQRQDELGALARSFDHMQTQIRQQFDELQCNRLELEHLARHDALTGLPNRRLFMERLDTALDLAHRHSGQLALLFIDLDEFKSINDRFGHDGGDATLQAVARRLQANTRRVDMVARLGGDEFVVLIDSPANRDQVRVIAQKLQASMQEPISLGDASWVVGLSIGISLFPQDGDTADVLMRQADTSMYRVKKGHDTRYHFAGDTPSPGTHSQG